MDDMDLLKLAQLHNAKNKLKEDKLNLVKKINIHYSIPSETYRILHKHSYLGYNCLHIAALNLDYDFIQELLNRGADLFKQGMQDHKTPLHIAVDQTVDSIKKQKGISIWKIGDKLQSCQVIDTLLSAHVTSGNSMNPKCKNGISHLHIACMFNCTDLVAFLLKSGESANQVTNTNTLWPGYAPLHFAARYSCDEAVQCLIDNGADVGAKDAKGISPLYILIERLLLKINHVSLDRFSFDIRYEEEIKRLEAIVSTLIENKINSNVLDDTGLTVFHIACILRDSSVAAQLLKDIINLNMPVNMDSKFWAGWTPLHFAACSSAETVKLLVQTGADITVKNERKQTPLDICLKRYYPSIVHSILSTKEEFKNILFSDNLTNLLDLLLAMKNSKSFNSYLDSIENPNICVSFISPILPGYSLLHLALSLKEKLKFQQNIDFLPQNYNCPRHVSEPYSNKIRALLSKGASVHTTNFDGLTPIHLAFSSHCSPSTVTELLSECERDAIDLNGLTLLHIACALDHLPTVKKLIRAQANVNSVAKKSFQWYRSNAKDSFQWYRSNDDRKTSLYAVNANSTPLHVAVAFMREDVIAFLLDNGADVHAQDAEGLTPIHLSIAADDHVKRSTARLIFSKVGALKDRTSREGLTHLHVAAYAGDPAAVKKLVLDGANVNCVVGTEVPEFLFGIAGMTPLQIAIQISSSRETVEALIELGADSHVDGLVHYLMLRCDSSSFQNFYDELKLQDNVREPIEPSGLTLLHVACDRLDIDWAEELLKKGADVNAKISDDEDYKGLWKGNTPLHVLAFRALKFRPDNEFTLKTKRLAGLLLKHNADVTIASDYGTALLINMDLFDGVKNFTNSVDSAVNEDQELARSDTLFDKMLQANSTDSCGTSYFHLLCIRNDAREIIEKFLDSGVDVNHSKSPLFGVAFQGFTALHFACSNFSMVHVDYDVKTVDKFGQSLAEFPYSGVNGIPSMSPLFDEDETAFLFVMRGNFSFETASLLMERGANVNAEDLHGNTPLHIAVRNWRDQRDLLDCFKRHGADFNAKNTSGGTPVDVLMTTEDFSFELLQYFLTNGSSITLERSETIRKIMENAAHDDLLQILQTLVKVCNIKDAIVRNGYNPVEEVVCFWPERLVNERKYDNYLDVIQVFVNEDCDVNQRSENGDTPLRTAIRRVNAAAATEALLQVGADVNCIRKSSQIHPEVRGLIALHVYKMKILGLHVSATSNEIYEIVRGLDEESEGTSSINAEIEKSCKTEMEKAKRFRITNSLTADVFLSEREAVVQYSRMLPNQRRDIDSFFKGVVHLNKEFPQLAGLMICQYKKAARPQRIKSARDVLALECDMDFPDPCLEGILDYFSNNELEYLIENSVKARNIR